MKNRTKFHFIWMISILILMASPLIDLCVTSISQNTSASSSSFPGSSNITNNNSEECMKLSNQHVVFADIHIIQALRDLADGNKSGALNQLSLAEGQLEKASESKVC